MMQFSFDAILALLGISITGTAMFAGGYWQRASELRVQVCAKPIGANDITNPNHFGLYREDAGAYEAT